MYWFFQFFCYKMFRIVTDKNKAIMYIILNNNMFSRLLDHDENKNYTEIVGYWDFTFY